MEKEFIIGRQNEKKQPHYKDKILKIINDIEESVRMVEPDTLLHKELHAQKVIDARKEVQEFESVRRDVCESFGVPYDDEHIFIYKAEDGSGRVEQRAFRAFYVLIDAITRESFYGEGRVFHNVLLNNLIHLLNKKEEKNFSTDEVYDGVETNPPRFIMFKGFVSKTEEGFNDLSPTSNRVLETPVFDKEGNKIETPSNWFITGHNASGSETL